MIKNVVFDMGNVLLKFDPQVPLEEFCSSQEEKEAIRRELFEGPEWIEGDLGNITNEEKYRRICARIPEHMHAALKRCVYEAPARSKRVLYGDEAKGIFDLCAFQCQFRILQLFSAFCAA